MSTLALPAIESLHTIYLYDAQHNREVPVACVVVRYEGAGVVIRYRDRNGNVEESLVSVDRLSSR